MICPQPSNRAIAARPRNPSHHGRFIGVASRPRVVNSISVAKAMKAQRPATLRRCTDRSIVRVPTEGDYLEGAHMEASETKAIQELRAAWRQFTDASEELQCIHGEEAAKGDLLLSLKDEGLRRRREEATSSVQAALEVIGRKNTPFVVAAEILEDEGRS